MKSKGTNAIQMMLSNYIKFDRLNEICGSIFDAMPSKIDIYIDLNSMLYGLYKGYYKPELDVSDTCIASSIINMIAHYRRFFRNYNISTRFFLVYSTMMEPSPRKFVPEWNSNILFTMSDKNTIHAHIIQNIELVKEICSYIADVNFTITSFEPGVMMYHIMGVEEENCDVNIVITKDLITNQLAAISPMTVIFRPKKYKGEDTSFFISPFNGGLFSYLCDRRNTKYKPEWSQINPGLYSFILAATRIPEKNVKSLLSLPTAFDATLEALASQKVLNGYNTDVRKFCEEMSEKTYVNLLHGNIEARFRAVDTIYNYGILISSPELYTYTGCKNLYDPNGIHELDTKYFDKCHLNLEYL